MTGLSLEDRISLTISEIEYSDEYDENYELFEKGISILKNHNPDNEFSSDDREVLEEIFTVISP